MKTWHKEHAVLLPLLAATVLAVGPSLATAGWAGAAYFAHTGKSHAGRQKERPGFPVDWLSEVAAWGAALCLSLTQPPSARALILVGIAWNCGFTCWRFLWRTFGQG